jgi:ElaB/YqjD/DUF883 family membrane-anchored ribosome-binding protein
MSNRDPLYGKSDKSGSDDLGFDSTLSDSSTDSGNSTFSDSDGVTFDSTLSETADDRDSFGSSAQGSLYDSASGSINEGDTTEQWEEFYDATTSDDAGSTGTMDDMKNKAQDTMGTASEKKDQVMDKASGVMDQASGMMGQGKEKAGEMAGMAQGKVDGGMTKAGETMDNAAQMLRDKGEQGGAMGTVADTAANAMESAGSFLQEANTGEMMDQLENYIRQNPTQALLIAAGVGFVLAKAFK